MKKIHKWKDLRDQHITPARQRAIDEAVAEELLEMTLRELREHFGMSQAEIAEAMKVSQAEASRNERRTDHLVSSLRRVVEALGGELKVSARFKDREIELKGV